MKRHVLVALMLGAALISGTRGLAQEKSSFVGMWKAAQRTGGITVARIFEQDGRRQVQLWGACSPTDCDWGTAAFSQLPDAEAKLPDRGFALYSGRYTTFRLDGADLIIELYRVPDVGSAARPHYGIIRLVRGS